MIVTWVLMASPSCSLTCASLYRRPAREPEACPRTTFWDRSPVRSVSVSELRRRAPDLLAAAFTTSGLVHLVRPATFAALMPRVIPARHHRGLIYLSGLAELICAAGLWRRTSWAAPASVAVLGAVFPANVQMALDAGSGRNPGPADKAVVAWGRLPYSSRWSGRRSRRGPDAWRVSAQRVTQVLLPPEARERVDVVRLYRDVAGSLVERDGMVLLGPGIEPHPAIPERAGSGLECHQQRAGDAA